MTRTTAREIAMQLAFELDFYASGAEELLERRFDAAYYVTLGEEDGLYADCPDEKQAGYIRRLVTGTSEHSAELNNYIGKYSKGWNISRISRVAIAIMKIAMFEILYMEDIPNAAAINEAVEIAKKYEDGETVAFLNGILGSFVRSELP